MDDRTAYSAYRRNSFGGAFALIVTQAWTALKTKLSVSAATDVE
jgi:hypothetical protein